MQLDIYRKSDAFPLGAFRNLLRVLRPHVPFGLNGWLRGTLRGLPGKDRTDVVQRRGLRAVALGLVLAKYALGFDVAQRFQPLADFGQGQMFLLEQPDQTKPGKMPIIVSGSRPGSSGRPEQSRLDVKMHSSRGYIGFPTKGFEIV